MEDALTKIKEGEVTSALYAELSEKLQELGAFEVEVKQSSLHITNGRAFLGIHPRKNALLINIVSDKPITSTRLKKTEKVSANRYHNELIVDDVTQIDNELMSWLSDAYALTIK